MDAVLDNAVARCPFLARVAAAEGVEFAKMVALDPTKPAGGLAQCRRPVLEELQDYSSTFKLWHGASGFLPLGHVQQQAAPKLLPLAPGSCPQPLKAPPAASISSSKCSSAVQAPPAVGAAAPAQGNGRDARTSPLAPRGLGCAKPLPLASMSLSFGGNMPDFGKFLRSLQEQHNKVKQHVRRAKQQGPNNNSNSSRNTTGAGGKGPQVSSAASAASEPTGGLCPLRKVLGPLAPMVFNPKGHIQCPEAIVRARAALAATRPVRELRPQALPIKLLAVGATTMAVNVPCGMAREHTEKFSFGWFVAVHASIPFIAMLRKAVIMPKYAILFTIATAIAGQAMGAKMERRRMQQLALAADSSTTAAAPSVSRAAALSSELVARRAASAKLVVGKARLSSSSSSSSSMGQAPALALANTTAATMGAPAIWAKRDRHLHQQPQGIAQAADAFKLLLGTDGAAAAAASGAGATFSMSRSALRGAGKGLVLRRQGGAGGRALGALMAPPAAALLEARA